MSLLKMLMFVCLPACYVIVQTIFNKQDVNIAYNSNVYFWNFDVGDPLAVIKKKFILLALSHAIFSGPLLYL